jgi:hypothetical protein
LITHFMELYAPRGMDFYSRKLGKAYTYLRFATQGMDVILFRVILFLKDQTPINPINVQGQIRTLMC